MPGCRCAWRTGCASARYASADYAARTLTQAQVDTLRHLAEAAAQALLSRQRAVQALAAATRSGARLQRLYDATPVMMHSADEAGRLVSASDLWLSNLGYARDEVIGRAVGELLGSDAAAPTALPPDAGSPVETRILRRDGSTLDVLMSSLEDLDQTAGSRLVLTVIEDITERRQAQARLDAAHGFLQRTGLVAGVGGWEIDIRSSSVTWSDHTCRLHDQAPGYRPTLEEGFAYYAEEGRPAITAAVTAALEQGTPWDLELPLVSAAGRRFWARVVGSVEREDGHPVRLVGAFQDISARKQIEQDLEESPRAAAGHARLDRRRRDHHGRGRPGQMDEPGRRTAYRLEQGQGRRQSVVRRARHRVGPDGGRRPRHDTGRRSRAAVAQRRAPRDRDHQHPDPRRGGRDSRRR